MTAAGTTGATVIVSGVPWADTLALVECTEGTPECLQRLLAALEMQVIILGHVAPADGRPGVTATLTSVRVGEAPVAKTYELTSTDVDGLVKEFKKV